MAKKKLDSLLEYARTEGMSESDLHALKMMFWRIWAHPDLIGFRLVAESLRQIGLLAAEMWNDQLNLFGMERWPVLLKWLADREPSMWAEIGIDEEVIGKNPMKQHGFEAEAIYSALCQTRALDHYKKEYRLLQGHIVFAFSMALGELSNFDKYQEMCHTAAGEAIIEPLSFYPCYRVGYALRRLGNEEPEWTALLGALEVNRTPSSFAVWIGTFELTPGIVQSKQAREDFRVIQNFLVGIYKDQWKKVVRRAGGTREFTTRESVHGRVEFGLWSTVFTQTVFTQTEDGSVDREDEFYYFIDPLTVEERKQLGNSVDDSEDKHEFSVSKSSVRGPARQSGWKQNNRKMMANQFLPFDYEELNGSQLGLLWSGLDLWWKRVKPEDLTRDLLPKDLLTLEIGALLWVMLWTVSPISRAVCLDVLGDPEDLTQSPLSLLDFKDRKSGLETRRWRIKALPPKVEMECPNSRRMVDHILLPDVCGGGAWAIAFLLRKKVKTPTVFDRPLKEYQWRITNLFAEFREKNHIADPITASRYSKVLFWRILRQSRHDFTAVSLILGQDHPLSTSRLHYTTRLVADMQKLYVKCADDLAGEMARVWGMQFNPIDFPIEERKHYLGARQCPTLKNVSAAVNTLRERVKQTPRLQFPKNPEEQMAFTSNHNEFTLYTYWMFAFATGIRGIVNPYPRIETVDSRTGIYSFEDKTANSGDIGYKQRVVRLPRVLLDQMQAYNTYMKGLKRKYQLECNEPCFFVVFNHQQLLPVEIRPVELESRAKELLPFPANTQRLFLRSELLGRGCGAELVDAFMGHWAFGEEPWAPYSTFNYAVYFATLKPYIETLLTDLKFEVVRKRIVD